MDERTQSEHRNRRAQERRADYLRGAGRQGTLDVDGAVIRAQQVVACLEGGDETSARHFMLDLLCHLSGHYGAEGITDPPLRDRRPIQQLQAAQQQLEAEALELTVAERVKHAEQQLEDRALDRLGADVRCHGAQAPNHENAH